MNFVWLLHNFHPKGIKFDTETSILLENETHKILLDFEIQTNHSISAKRESLLIIQKRACHPVDLAVTADNIVKIKEREKN